MPTLEQAQIATLESRTNQLKQLQTQFRHVENTIHHELVKHSVSGLRIALGLVFLGFGILKYFPGVSPAQGVTEATTHILFLGLIPGGVAIKLIATLECFIGVCLLSNRWMRLCVWLLAIEFIGILSPIVLLSGQLFSGPHHAPTLLGQYCLKDIILVAGGLVVAAASFRGGRMIREDLPPTQRVDPTALVHPEERVRLVVAGLTTPARTRELCAQNNVSEAEFYRWRDAILGAATDPDHQPTPRDTEPIDSTPGLSSDRAPSRRLGPAAVLVALAALIWL